MKNLMPASLAAAIVFVSGCMADHEYTDPQANDIFAGSGATAPSNMKLQNAFMKGDIGPVTGLNGPATVDGYDDTNLGSTTINMTSQSPTGSGLVILNLDRSIQNLPVGTTHMTGNNDMSNPSYVQLCSDTASGESQHFDGMAEDVAIVVTQRDANTRDVDVTAKISQGFDGPTSAPTTVNSHFSVLR